jgi:uncharacterized membrane protein
MQLNTINLSEIVKKPAVQLGFVLLVGFLFRLYRIDNPVLDWHAFRQADTASVTARYVEEGIDLLRPRYHDLSNIQSGQDNPEGYRMVEFPIINAFIAIIVRALPQLDLVITSRFMAVLFSIGTALSLYWLVKQLSSHPLALLSTTFFCFLPFSIFYGRVVLPEPFYLFFSTFSLATFTAYLSTQKKVHWLLATISLALALLLKPFALFLAPVYLTLILIQNKTALRHLSTYLSPFLACIPLFLWRNWIANFPEGIPDSLWLYNSDKIRFRPAWFRWLFWERISKLIGGYLAPVLLLSNLLARDKLLSLVVSWWISIILFFSVIATGNVRHDYYQVLIIPALSLSLARGVLLLQPVLQKLISTRVNSPKKISVIVLTSLCLLMSIFSWLQLHGYYNVNHWEYQRAGQTADLLLPPDALVIAPTYGGDTMLLFQTKRFGWPLGYNIDNKINLGATHYISANFDDEATSLEEKYYTLKKTDEFIIIDLTRPKIQQ